MRAQGPASWPGLRLRGPVRGHALPRVGRRNGCLRSTAVRRLDARSWDCLKRNGVRPIVFDSQPNSYACIRVCLTNGWVAVGRLPGRMVPVVKELLALDAARIERSATLFFRAHERRTQAALTLHLLRNREGLLPGYALAPEGRADRSRAARALQLHRGAEATAPFDSGSGGGAWWTHGSYRSTKLASLRHPYEAAPELRRSGAELPPPRGAASSATKSSFTSLPASTVGAVCSCVASVPTISGISARRHFSPTPVHSPRDPRIYKSHRQIELSFSNSSSSSPSPCAAESMHQDLCPRRLQRAADLPWVFESKANRRFLIFRTPGRGESRRFALGGFQACRLPKITIYFSAL